MWARGQNTGNVFQNDTSHMHMICALLPVSVWQKGMRVAESPEAPTSRLKVQLPRKAQGSRAAPSSPSGFLPQRVRFRLPSNTSNPLIGALPNFSVCFASEANTTKPQTEEATATTGKNLFCFSFFFLNLSEHRLMRGGMELNGQCADTSIEIHSVANPGWWSCWTLAGGLSILIKNAEGL